MIVHLNGQLIPAEHAAVSPFDRAYVFGDAIYEGLRSFRGRVVAVDRHVRRFRNSLAEARIPWGPSHLDALSRQLMAANSMPDAFVYWQISRGVPGPGQPVRTRTPAGPMAPTVFGYCSPQPPIEVFATPPTCTAAVRPDTRWTRGHIKSTSLLGNVLASMEAQDAGAQDTILVRNSLVAEGSATNVIVALNSPDGRTELATPSLDSVSILGGITRELLIQGAPEIVQRPVRVEELYRASEVMLVGSTSMVTSVLVLDGRPVGTGAPGAQSLRLLRVLVDMIRTELKLGDGTAQVEIAPNAGDMLSQCRTSRVVA